MAVRNTPSKGGKPDKLWRDALMPAVKRRAKGKDSPHELDEIADTCVKAALQGESWAVREIGERLDGKAVTPIAGVEDQPQKLIVEIIDPTRPA